jgi:hypothetical protein
MVMPIMRRTSFLLAAACAVLAAAPARAQSGNNSDNGGFIPGGGGGHSGGFLGPGLRTENELFARNGREVVFRNARTACALRGAERLYRDSVAATTPTAAEARVQTLLGVRDGTGDVDAVAAALRHGASPESPLGQAARALADALNGLMRDRGACGTDREDFGEAGQWQDAIRAYNDYIRVAPAEAFSPPAPELVAIHDALQSVVYHTLRNPNAP